VYVDSVEDLGAIELALEVSGGTSGALELTAITVDSQRQDYVFESCTAYQAKNLTKGSLSNALETGCISTYPWTSRRRSSRTGPAKSSSNSATQVRLKTPLMGSKGTTTICHTSRKTIHRPAAGTNSKMPDHRPFTSGIARVRGRYPPTDFQSFAAPHQTLTCSNQAGWYFRDGHPQNTRQSRVLIQYFT